MPVVNFKAAIEPYSGKAAIPVLANLGQLIKSMFANNEQGFTREPYDLTTLFHDMTGTVSVTSAGQPVGLILDKSRGLKESNYTPQQDTFVFNPEGTTPPTTATTVFDGSPCVSATFPEIQVGGYLESRAEGAYHIVNKGTFYRYHYKLALSRKLNPGERIQVYVTGSNGTSANILDSSTQDNVWLDMTSQSLIEVGGINGFTVFAWRTSGPVTVYATGLTIDTVDIGNYAYQPTSSMRPLVQDTPRRIDYDAVDDKLITNLPTELTGCTVIRSVPNVGTQILTNQTIPTPYNDSTDHCGLIVINRALTVSETSQITQLFNKASGV